MPLGGEGGTIKDKHLVYDGVAESEECDTDDCLTNPAPEVAEQSASKPLEPDVRKDEGTSTTNKEELSLGQIETLKPHSGKPTIRQNTVKTYEHEVVTVP